MLERSLTMLNERGDTTITWTADQDAEMEAIIAKKIAAGVTFYTVPSRKPGQKGRIAKPKKLTDASKAHEHRALSIPDPDFSKFVLEGKGTAVQSTEPDKIGTTKRATAKEVASGHSVGVKARKGG